ncbi:MAG: 50S ribosomal protein L25/general stress protein Ctc [Psychroflexus sp.]|jgi:large subunit ribosomal protein L25|nr:50S ribosomal protein L25/general stress protein Ctc [Psychroflexus sp.]MDR9447598.1 50S ribosomal protein L25/general stress protein Ctc [Psychroflexus sp.]
MKSITINGSQRESVGKKATKALRNAGKVPCVLYGGNEAFHFSANEIAFKDLIYTPDVHTVKIVLDDGRSTNAVLQDIQFHPVTDQILHMDFYEFEEGQEISMEIPVHAEGTPKGVKNGGVLRFNMRRMTLKGLASKLPDYIAAKVGPLKIGDNLYAEDVKSDEYEVLHEDDELICQVTAARDLELIEDDDEEDEDGEEGEEGESSEDGDNENKEE